MSLTLISIFTYALFVYSFYITGYNYEDYINQKEHHYDFLKLS